MAGNTDGSNAPSVKSLSAVIGMAGGGVFNFDTTGDAIPDLDWETKSFTFEAGATSGLLSFSSNNNDPYGAALDNIRIVEAVSTVPLPAGGLLLLSGLGALALRRKRG